MNFEQKVDKVLKAHKEMLMAKNKAYGNSALEPVRIFSKVDAVEQLKVRIDDKLSRLAKGNDFADEDTVTDLLGYLVLLKVALLGDDTSIKLKEVMEGTEEVSSPYKEDKYLEQGEVGYMEGKLVKPVANDGNCGGCCFRDDVTYDCNSEESAYLYCSKRERKDGTNIGYKEVPLP